MPCQADDELAFDLPALKDKLRKEKEAGRGVILCYGLGEVNTGGFGSGLPEVARLCKDYGAWLHVDAGEPYIRVAHDCRLHQQPLEASRRLCQSSDTSRRAWSLRTRLLSMVRLHSAISREDPLSRLLGHKWLNVPYDCGIFYTKARGTLPGLLGPPASSLPAYLAAPPSAEDEEAAQQPIPPLYLNLESSRRLRALPVISSLIALGKDGYVGACRLCSWIQNSCSWCQTLSVAMSCSLARLRNTSTGRKRTSS